MSVICVHECNVHVQVSEHSWLHGARFIFSPDQPANPSGSCEAAEGLTPAKEGVLRVPGGSGVPGCVPGWPFHV